MKERLIFNTPIKKSLFFLLFPFFFYLLDFLNYSRAGKIALIGVLLIGTIDSLRVMFPKNKLFKYLLYLVTVVIFLNMSFHAGLRDIFGIEQDDIVIMQVLFGTDTNEVKEFIIQYKFFLIKHVIIFIVMLLSFFFVLLRENSKIDRVKVKKSVTIFSILLIIIHLNPTMRRSNPFFYFPYYYSKWKHDITSTKKLQDEIDKNINLSKLSTTKYTGKDKNRTVVLVIGESDTKYNWSMYGYKRETNPKMKLLKNELLVFKNIYTSAPSTISSFEKMLTPATKSRPGLWQTKPDILLMAKKAGYHTYWISNQSTDSRGVMNIFATHADETILTNKGRSRGEGSYDESFLEPYKKALKDNYDKKFIIVHMLGSHPAYNFRYPKEYSYFTFIFDDSVMLQLKEKGIYKWALVFRNLYDNSVLYSDTIRYKLLMMLKNSKESRHSSWIYLPDHGQDVCHHNNFSGHNHKVKEQWEIPMLVWPLDIKRLDENITDRKYTTDFIDHTVLGLLKIHGEYYNKKYDIFSKDFDNRNMIFFKPN